MQRKFLIAMACYAAIAIFATMMLDGKIRDAVWILMGALALKTAIARRAGW